MDLEKERASLAKYGQEHLLQFAEELSKEECEKLVKQIQGIDFGECLRIFNETKKAESPDEGKIEPFTDIYNLDRASLVDGKRWREKGFNMIGEGKAAILLLGGGMGTRLGSPLPKGLFDIKLPSRKSIFQIQAERLRRVKELAARHCDEEDIPKGGVSIPWYIMTSEPTHKPTVKFFEENNFFGLPKSDVFFFQQGLMPCMTPEGKIILESKSRIACSPDGNGGVFKALQVSGALDDMKRRGTLYIHMFSVDNVLIKVADPTFLGHCLVRDVDCCNKVCVKFDPEERVGVMCLKNGSPYVIEYSEISKEMSEMTNEDDSLVYGAGNIAIHCFKREFLEEVALSSLPYHIAHKKVSYISDSGEEIVPEDKNAVKLEMFLFDIFPRSSKMTCLQVARTTEFAPVKNKSGSETDSPDTARQLLSNLNICRIRAAGGEVKRKEITDVCEISPLLSYEGEDLEKLVDGKTFELPIHLQ